MAPSMCHARRQATTEPIAGKPAIDGTLPQDELVGSVGYIGWMPQHVQDVSTADFAVSVIEASHHVPVVVDLWAEWCGPCKVLGPVLERAAEEAGGAWVLAKLDVDQSPEISQQLGVQGIPTVVAFKNGVEVDRFTGAIPEAEVRQFLDRLSPSVLDVETAAGDDALDAGDTERASAIYSSVLEKDPTHPDAGLSLAGLLIEEGEVGNALEILDRLAPTEAVRQLQAYARLGNGAADIEALERAAADGTTSDRLALGRALAASGQGEAAIETLMGVIGERVEPDSDEAQKTLLDLFELLGQQHPQVAGARRALANGLY